MLCGIVTASVCLADDDDVSRWEEAIQEFEHSDRDQPPPSDGILFIGSSSIRKWNLSNSFPDLPVFNRGFGGSQIADSVEFADRIVVPYRPRAIVFYAGDNDISREKTPARVQEDFQEFTSLVHSELPETRIIFIAIKPSIARWELVDRMRAANALIRADCEEHRLLTFVDVDVPMLGDNGQPREELFVDDGLHLSDEGYSLWSELVRPHLESVVNSND